jgi:penicillin G amidase
MRRFLRYTAVLLALVVLVPAGYAGLTVLRAHGGLPQLDGRASMPGIRATVEILRDPHGIPHVFAESEADAYFAQGFLHAQDRLWQMTLTRQTVAGRLAEWLGPLGVSSDRLHRNRGYAAALGRYWADFPADEKSLLEAYAAGVNAYLDSEFYRRPPEMKILHVHPEPWRPEDSVLVYKATSPLLQGGGNESLWPRLRDFARVPFAGEALLGNDLPVRTIIEDGAVSRQESSTLDNTFSDNWTLAGAHTVSGKPLMANDPQLSSSMPNFWYLVHLSVEGRNLVGASLPGIPGVAVGRNDRLAWGITNGFADQRDFMLLEADPERPEWYRRGSTEPWLKFEQRTETIKVRFGRDITEMVYSTPTGTVLPDHLLLLPMSREARAMVETRSVGQDEETTPAALLRLNRAGNVQEAVKHLGLVTSPSLSFTLADVDGDIAYVLAGRIPLRPTEHATGVNFAPEDSNEWELLDYGLNPSVMNPPSGRLVTANQKVAGDAYPYYLSDRWAPPERAHRIHELLDATPLHDRASFVRMQQDTLSLLARRLAPKLRTVRPASDDDATVASLLHGWDFRFDLDSPAPLVFMVWTTELNRWLMADKLAPELFPALHSPGLALLERALGGTAAHWCDRYETEAVETCEDALSGSLTTARLALEAAYGSDASAWRWGAASSGRHPHLGLAGLPWLGNLFSRRVPYPGGPETLFVRLVDLGGSPRFEQSVNASSYQAVYDLSDLDASLYMLSGGASGHFRSPWYDNLLEPWARGERITIPTRKDAIDVAARLVLSPP